MANYERQSRPRQTSSLRDYGIGTQNYSNGDYDDYDYAYEQQNYENQMQPTWYYEEYWWAVPGPYTGMGPRGYERSDKDILKEVNDRLAANGQLDASNIEAGVNDCVVTLSGTVNSRQDKRLAEDIADSVVGVEDVDNQLHVNRQQQQNSARAQNQNQGQSQDENENQNQGQNQNQSRHQHENQNRAQGTGGNQSSNAGSQSSQIWPGEGVVGSSGKVVGRVKKVYKDHFTLNRPLARDLQVPYDAVKSANRGQIQLNIPADQIGNQGWKTV